MKRLATTLLSLTLLLAACGEEDEEEGSAGTGPPEAEAAIVVESPQPGEAVSSPVTVSGSASVFEANVSIRIRDALGEPIAETFATATAGAPERGEFSEQVRFRVDEAQSGTIEVYEANAGSPSEGGGPESNLVEIAVTLEP